MRKHDLTKSRRPRFTWLWVLGVCGLGCFAGPDRAGWPCNDDGDCGLGAYCVDAIGVCANNGTDGFGQSHVPCDDAGDGMVCVEGGAFSMGVPFPNDGKTHCGGPVRYVFMPTFYLDRSETTVAEYRACVTAGVCTALEPSSSGGTCTSDMAGSDFHPVTCVDWTQASRYCLWQGKRLPTAAEWEKGARGTDSRQFPWGDENPTCDHIVAQVPGCNAISTMPVGSHSPLGDSPYGATDMMGNVAEWNADWYDCIYDPEETEDPQGPQYGGDEVVGERVLRGGSWERSVGDPYQPEPQSSDRGQGDIGFRCARDP